MIKLAAESEECFQVFIDNYGLAPTLGKCSIKSFRHNPWELGTIGPSTLIRTTNNVDYENNYHSFQWNTPPLNDPSFLYENYIKEPETINCYFSKTNTKKTVKKNISRLCRVNTELISFPRRQRV